MPHYRLPDPHDRSPNAPAILLEPKDINHICMEAVDIDEDDKTLRAQAQRKWLTEKAYAAGWGEVTLIGMQVLLRSDVRVEQRKAD